MTVSIVEGDVFEVDLLRRSFALVYADPPYAGCRAKYARRNNSRQWGLNPRADFMRELIGRMESLRTPDGICAVSMGSGELKLMHLFPSSVRVMAWVKDTASPRPGIWPTFAWEPLVVWGALPGKHEQKQAGTTPKDWTRAAPDGPANRDSGHETPKPYAFAQWVISVTLGLRRGPVLDLFAGSGALSIVADQYGMDVTAVDLTDWTKPRMVVGRGREW